MIIHMAEGATIDQVERVINRISQDYGLRCETIVSSTTVIGVKGVAAIVDEGRITELPGVDRVIRITEKYKDAARSFHHQDSVVHVGGRRSRRPELARQHADRVAEPQPDPLRAAIDLRPGVVEGVHRGTRLEVEVAAPIRALQDVAEEVGDVVDVQIRIVFVGDDEQVFGQ
mgnify:CR=1 FL=1